MTCVPNPFPDHASDTLNDQLSLGRVAVETTCLVREQGSENQEFPPSRTLEQPRRYSRKLAYSPRRCPNLCFHIATWATMRVAALQPQLKTDSDTSEILHFRAPKCSQKFRFILLLYSRLVDCALRWTLDKSKPFELTLGDRYPWYICSQVFCASLESFLDSENLEMDISFDKPTQTFYDLRPRFTAQARK